jgi:hypothetical protein
LRTATGPDPKGRKPSRPETAGLLSRRYFCRYEPWTAHGIRYSLIEGRRVCGGTSRKRRRAVAGKRWPAQAGSA